MYLFQTLGFAVALRLDLRAARGRTDGVARAERSSRPTIGYMLRILIAVGARRDT